MAFDRLYYHIVFRTKNRINSIDERYEKELYAYIHAICKNKNVTLIRINGTPCHIHMLIRTHTAFTLSDFVRDIKRASSLMMMSNKNFPLFDGWGEKYACDTISFHEVEKIRAYIMNQKEHHKKIHFEEELREIFGIEFTNNGFDDGTR